MVCHALLYFATPLPHSYTLHCNHPNPTLFTTPLPNSHTIKFTPPLPHSYTLPISLLQFPPCPPFFIQVNNTPHHLSYVFSLNISISFTEHFNQFHGTFLSVSRNISISFTEYFYQFHGTFLSGRWIMTYRHRCKYRIDCNRLSPLSFTQSHADQCVNRRYTTLVQWDLYIGIKSSDSHHDTYSMCKKSMSPIPPMSECWCMDKWKIGSLYCNFLIFTIPYFEQDKWKF